MYLGKVLYIKAGVSDIVIGRIFVVGCSRENGENISPVIRSFPCCSLDSYEVGLEWVAWSTGLLF